MLSLLYDLPNARLSGQGTLSLSLFAPSRRMSSAAGLASPMDVVGLLGGVHATIVKARDLEDGREVRSERSG